MKSPQQKQSIEQLTHKMVQKLESIRDALTRLSLTLNDLQFETDAPQRQAAIAQAAEFIKRSQARRA